MTENQIFEAQKTRIYKRLGIGSILGGSIFFAAGLGLAWFGDIMNPVRQMKRTEDNFRDFKESISIMIATLRNQEGIIFDCIH